MDAKTAQPFTIQHFQAKWRGVTLKERSASQSHFNDLCHMLGVPTPTDADPTGSFYTFERGAEKTAGGAGWADVWFRGHFAWEYKGHHANLKKAYAQLLQYREDLENPPLLVVCDLDRFEVHTNFTGTVKKVYTFSLADLDEPAHLAVLKALWTEPTRLRPDTTPEAVTQEAAERFGALAASLQARDVEPHRAAHFLVQLLFCLFAEDVGLLPRRLFTDLLTNSVRHPDRFASRIEGLLVAMRDGGDYGSVALDRFNGGLFAEIAVEPLTAEELSTLSEAGRLDWASVEPAIFGTLFERSLDPSQRAQLGAHYTGRTDIERVVEPVVLAPLRRRWDAVKAEAEKLKAQWQAASATATQERRRRRRGDAVANARTAFANVLFAFQEELAAVRVLDPACGSGNFLYVALAGLQDLEKEVVTYGVASGLPAMLPRAGPAQLAGLEVNAYARELAQVVVWIGYLQWMTSNGFQVNRDPVLEPLETIRLQDALLDRSDPEHAKEAEWPAADFIIGNPPFLGGKRLRTELGDAYVDDLFRVFEGRVPAEADLVCYFFEKARVGVAEKHSKRAGLLATNSIRGGVNREVLQRIKASGDVFMAWDDEPWILNGAAVRIAIVGFDDGSETSRVLDGTIVSAISSDLTAGVDITSAPRLDENRGMAFMGDTKGGPFEIPDEIARRWLALPMNPNGRSNSEVVRPWVNSLDLTRRPRRMWIIDFGTSTPEGEAALFEAPYEYVRTHVRPMRAANRRASYRERWWLHVEPRSGMRTASEGLERFVVTPTVAKHRLFAWLPVKVLPDHQLIVFARQDDYFFGVLHSRAHEVWSLRMGTWLGVGNDPRYTPTTCFETFPLPWPPGQEPWRDDRLHAIANAARELDQKRRAYLDPPDATEAELKKRTLTNLYNERPAWLDHAHAALDRAVWAAYGWDDPEPAAVPEDQILARLLALNQERSKHSSAPLPM
ncbi:MAG: class I SAM-dependent DNA methyltransferase [Chloroflexota bacterium]|nr:class I SAM-dependent DNA methyltransferase [Chloroflexota bacterium]